MKQLLPIAMMGALAACGASAGSSERDPGPVAARVLDLKGFDGVSLATSGEMKIMQGAAFAVKVTGPARVLDNLDIRVEGGTLKIDQKDEKLFNWSGREDHDDVLITVTMPELRRAALAGSGDIAANATAADRFEGDVAGSGTMRLTNFRAAKAGFNIAGSGDVEAAGTAGDVDIAIAGSGEIDASTLTATNIEVSVAGSGGVKARATGKARASLLGSGDVEIAGTKDCRASTMGSGELRCTG